MFVTKVCCCFEVVVKQTKGVAIFLSALARGKNHLHQRHLHNPFAHSRRITIVKYAFFVTFLAKIEHHYLYPACVIFIKERELEGQVYPNNPSPVRMLFL